MSFVVQPGGGVDLHSPGPIGDVTPSTGAFTTLSASGVVTLDGGGADRAHTVYSGALNKFVYTAWGRIQDEIEFGVAGAATQFFNDAAQGDAILKAPIGRLLIGGGSGGAAIYILSGSISGPSNTLALRNGANAQAFQVYNTYTDGANYERADLKWIDNVFEIGTGGVAGTGAQRGVRVYAGTQIQFGTNNVAAHWTISSSGHFLAATDNTYDIGASGANRPRAIYASGSLNGGSINLASGGGSLALSLDAAAFYFDSSGKIALRGTGIVGFGGITDSYPGIKNTGSDIEVVKAGGTAADTAIILASPDGTRYRITVSNIGVLTSTAA